MAEKKKTKPPKKKAKPAAKKKANELPKIISGNPSGGFLGMALRHHKGDAKKASQHYTRHAAKIATTVGEKDHVLVRRFMDSRSGRHLFGDVKRKVGKVGNWQHNAKLHYRNWRAAYDPAEWVVAEGTTMDKEVLNEKGVLKRVAKSAGRELGLYKTKEDREWGSGGVRRLGLTAAHTGAQAALGGVAGGMVGGPVGAAVGAAAFGAGAFGMQVRQGYKHLKRIGEDVEPFLQDLLDKGFSEEELEKIITEEDALMEAHHALLQAIMEDNPLEATEAFAVLMEDRVSEMVEGFKVYLATQMFKEDGDDDDDDDDDAPSSDDDSEGDDDVLRDPEQEMPDVDEVDLEGIDLDNLTDEERAALFPDETEEDDGSVEEGALSRFRDATRDKDKFPAIKAGLKAALRGKDKDKGDTYKGYKMKKMPNGDKC